MIFLSGIVLILIVKLNFISSDRVHLFSSLIQYVGSPFLNYSHRSYEPWSRRRFDPSTLNTRSKRSRGSVLLVKRTRRSVLPNFIGKSSVLSYSFTSVMLGFIFPTLYCNMCVIVRLIYFSLPVYVDMFVYTYRFSVLSL